MKSFKYNRKKEFVCYKEIEKMEINFYFIDPCCALQIWSNEKSNGLLRKYYSKRINLAKKTFKN